MATTCERCRAVEKQKYWEEFDKHHKFFKIMINDFRRKLRIPQKFATCFKNSHKLLGQKILTGPSGNTWLVEVKRTEEDNYVFCNGWEIFVKDHCLEDADLLVFKMDGFSAFDVMIFDATACEKETAFFVKKNRNPCKHPDEVTDEHTSEQQSSEDELSNDDDDDYDDTEEEDNIQEPARGRKSSRGKQYQFHSVQAGRGKKMKKILVAKQDHRKRKCTPLSSHKKNIEPEEKRPMFSNRRLVPEKERMKAHQLASKHRSSVPSVLMTMQPTHVCMGQLKIPKEWAQKHMRKKSETITVRIPSSGRTWSASIRCRMEGLVIQSGWEVFVMDNNLEEFDICVFELAQGGKHNSKPVILDVYIYRVKNEIMRPL